MSNLFSSKTLTLILLVLGIATIALSLLNLSEINKEPKKLPILGNPSLKETNINGVLRVDTVTHTVPDFALLDQDSVMISFDKLQGKVVVADFFFTSCPDICPIMTSQMSRVYDEFKDDDRVVFLSFSLDPYYDNVEVPNNYAKKIGMTDNSKWHFLQSKSQIETFRLTERGFLSIAAKDEDTARGVNHSGAFIMVDPDRKIRSLRDGTVPELVDIFIEELHVLLQEVGTGEA